ncbi:sugar/pyridoxal phosphate phosphatase YigL [Zophobihabitans entericus]|uniref:Sugar/pyridoxal phosphate phosphatase YigL n=1 Tax=Zophobihabitans entericus TaxID=1635327 RepID=A0A6G9IBJ2_9GAMM|nr:sugar/pyridoxal phosphate phosphatase YigL [Zophobihabitans entericus]QIQ20950.1 sugar/pyridoxal phosphate phosphatase YigL [Zophobihabitans entericus]
MYQVVASDLDGTLLNSDHRLSAYTKKVLQALTRQNIHFIFATGRHHIDVAQMRENMEIDAYMITSNGARVHNSHGDLIMSRNVSENVAAEVAKMAMDDKLIYTHIYRGDDWLINKEDAYSMTFFEESDFKYELFDPKGFPTDNIAKVYFTTTADVEHEHLVELKNNIEAQYGDHLNVAFSTLNCLEVMGKGVSKGSALQYVTEKLGYTLKDSIAFGDGMNDYEMLSMAGKGCIMRNAPMMLKSRLPNLEVIGSNADDAVPHYLNRLFIEKA